VKLRVSVNALARVQPLIDICETNRRRPQNTTIRSGDRIKRVRFRYMGGERCNRINNELLVINLAAVTGWRFSNTAKSSSRTVIRYFSNTILNF